MNNTASEAMNKAQKLLTELESSGNSNRNRLMRQMVEICPGIGDSEPEDDGNDQEDPKGSPLAENELTNQSSLLENPFIQSSLEEKEPASQPHIRAYTKNSTQIKKSRRNHTRVGKKRAKPVAREKK